MDLNLHRVDYHQVGITSRNTLKLLPIAGKTQKVVIGDNDGVVQCFQLKRGEVINVFTTTPNPAGVACLHLGGPAAGVKDRVFICSGTQVKGYTKKGKQFLSFNTNITEDISAMNVEGPHLFICSSHVMNHYLDCTDVSYYICPDQINDVITLPTYNSSELTTVLACQDHLLRVLQESEPLYEVELTGSPQTMQIFGDSNNCILYGTMDGRLGLVQLDPEEPTHLWTYPNPDQKGGITCMDQYDLTGDGVNELIVGRDDGLVEVFSYDDAGEPVLRFSYTFNESVTSVKCGIVGSPDFHEIVCATYAGWVIGLTTENSMRSVDSQETSVDSVAQTKIGTLKQELEDLTMKVTQEKERYQDAGQRPGNMSAIPAFSVNDKFVLCRDDASYTLGIEIQMAIDNILLQSDVALDLLDVEKSSAVVSHSPCNSEDGNMLLATYRCQANTTKLELKIRTIEGQYGTLQAYVTPRVHPKTCLLKQYQIKPLSLHQRTHTFDMDRPMNTLTLQGRFSMAETHCWIHFCLPELSERPPVDESATFNFESAFLGTQLQCCYKKGEVVFRSDNISTIAILKDVLTKEATSKKIKLHITYDINDTSVPHTLRLIHPHLEHQLILAKKVQLIEGLKELQTHEPDLSFLSPEYRDILENATQLQQEFKKQPCHLERLYGMITDLYIDKFKFRGENVKNKVSQLVDVLDNYDLPSLIHFFDSST